VAFHLEGTGVLSQRESIRGVNLATHI